MLYLDVLFCVFICTNVQLQCKAVRNALSTPATVAGDGLMVATAGPRLMRIGVTSECNYDTFTLRYVATATTAPPDGSHAHKARPTVPDSKHHPKAARESDHARRLASQQPREDLVYKVVAEAPPRNQLEALRRMSVVSAGASSNIWHYSFTSRISVETSLLNLFAFIAADDY